jgi:hypothetical protein
MARRRGIKRRKVILSAFQVGQIITVTRYLSQTESVTYQAVVAEVDGPKIRLDRCGPIGAASRPRRALAILFEPATDEPIKGYPDWYTVSAIPVELSRHTEGIRTMTAVVMEHIQVW